MKRLFAINFEWSQAKPDKSYLSSKNNIDQPNKLYKLTGSKINNWGDSTSLFSPRAKIQKLNSEMKLFFWKANYKT